jgi:hypothetical protein
MTIADFGRSKFTYTIGICMPCGLAAGASHKARPVHGPDEQAPAHQQLKFM